MALLTQIISYSSTKGFWTMLQQPGKGSGLTEKQKRILLLRAGLDGYQWTYKELANDFGLSISGIRQKEDKSLRSLKTPAQRSAMDSLYLMEFDELTAKGAQPQCFDTDYVETLREELREYAQLVEQSIENLGFSTRTSHALQRFGIRTIAELKGKNYEELSRIRDLGATRISEIQQRLRDYRNNP